MIPVYAAVIFVYVLKSFIYEYVCAQQILNWILHVLTLRKIESTYKFIEHFWREEVYVVRKFNCPIKKLPKGNLAVGRSTGADWQGGHSFLGQKHVGHQKNRQQQTCSGLEQTKMGTYWRKQAFGNSCQRQMISMQGCWLCSATWLRVSDVLTLENKQKMKALSLDYSFYPPSSYLYSRTFYRVWGDMVTCVTVHCIPKSLSIVLDFIM